MENKEEEKVDEDKVLVENYKSVWRIIGICGGIATFLCCIIAVIFIILL